MKFSERSVKKAAPIGRLVLEPREKGRCDPDFWLVESDACDGASRGRTDIDIKLTKKMLSQARVIAKGTRIREVDRPVAQYGGQASKWVKKSGPPLEVAGEHLEYHWYEHPGIGRFETKKVRLNRP